MKKNCRNYKSWKEKQIPRANNASYEQCHMISARTSGMFRKIKDVCYKVKDANKTHTWLLDSGATSHMACKKDLFITLSFEKRRFVSLADEEVSVEVQGIGSCVINCLLNNGELKKILLENVLYVPRLSSTLISIKKLARDGYKIVLEKEECNIFKNMELRAIVKPYGDLYELNTVEKVFMTRNFECSQDCAHVWHRLFGHRNLDAIKSLAERNLATGITIKDCKNGTDICECCIKGKMARVPFPQESSNKTQALLDLIHTDVCGPMQTITPGNKKYILTVIDDFSRYTKVYLLETKDQAAACIKNYVELVKTEHSRKPKIIRSDRGKEYVNKYLQDYLNNEGIKIQLTAAYSPQQNGVAERKNRSLMEMSRCMLIDANLEKKYWGEAVVTANFLQNRLPTKATKKTHFELWHSKVPDVGNLKLFGCKVYAHIPKEKRRKLDDKAKKLIFVGYSEESKAFRLLDKSTNKVVISRDVVFLDNKNNTAPIQEIKNPIPLPIRESEHKVNCDDVSSEVFLKRTKENIEKISEHQDMNVTTEDRQSNEGNVRGADVMHDNTVVVDRPEPRRSQRSNKGVPPDVFIASAKLTIDEPRTRNQALLSPDKAKWKDAMDEEIKSLLDNGTWEIVPAPKDRAIVSNKWVFKVKKDVKGQVEKYKARLVARGFSQKYGTDYDQLFAPVVRQTTFRAFLTISGKQSMIIRH